MRVAKLMSPVLLLLLSTLILAEPVVEGPKTLLDEIQPELIYGPIAGSNRHSSYMIPNNLVHSQVPFVVRWGLIYGVHRHEVKAACNSQMLSFFGTNDTMPSHLCNDPLKKRLVEIYTINYVYRREFPSIGVRSTQYLMSIGLTPLSKSTDRNTGVGYANFLGARIVAYFKNDGWNSRGHPRINYGRPFSDRTGYKPVNDPGIPESKLRYPLRWQPLIQTDLLGNFYTQHHVVPQIGITAKPFLMPRHELLKRKTKGPYRYPSRRWIHRVDRKNILRQAHKLFSISARLTRSKIQEAFWWDNKVYSVGPISAFYVAQMVQQGLIPFEKIADIIVTLAIAEGLAMHDAMVLAWHEKRRHDLARPQTLIRRLFRKN
uniref:TS-3 n=1 Tax=Laurencia subopposita TaxID=3071698 RepID=A0AA96V721_9FLOR|nr:TS-3 [Laurencia subopposita]